MYLVYDLETQNYTYYGRKASPWDERNWVIMVAYKHQDDTRCRYDYYPEYTRDTPLPIKPETSTLVLFNAKFDLLWLWKNKEVIDFIKRGGKIWCVQYAEYLLSGQNQNSHMISLEETSARYGGTEKLDIVKAMWAEGYKTADIQEQVLAEYAIGSEEEGYNAGDVGNTELCYLKQIERAKKMGMLTSIEQRMDGLLATTEMEFNGLYINTEVAKKDLARLTRELDEADEKLKPYLLQFPEGAIHKSNPSPLEFSWSSTHHVSVLIFGGSIDYRIRVPNRNKDGSIQYRYRTERHPLIDGEIIHPDDCEIVQVDGFDFYKHKETGALQTAFKSGKRVGEPRFRNVRIPTEPRMSYEDRIYDFDGYLDRQEVLDGEGIKGGWETKSTDARGKPIMRTNKDAIEIVESFDVPFCDALKERSWLDKEIGTYYVRRDNNGSLTGMLTCVDPKDKIIHHNLNHTSTVTGRLSSSNPNMQNLPRSGRSTVRKLFSSRFGAEGMMIEGDYSQIEVVVQGWLTGDENMIADLAAKVDFHCKRVALQYNIPYKEAFKLCKDESGHDFELWDSRRDGCKIFSFQRQYGAGIATICRGTGMSKEEVEALIDAENKEYPKVEQFITDITKIIEANARPFRDPARGHRTFRRGYWQAPTGSLYTFRTVDAPSFMKERGIEDTFYQPNIRNYPIQGTAGEIIQCTQGKLYRHFRENDNYGGKAFLCNTVHDSIWADAHISVYKEVAKDMGEIMGSVPKFFEDIYDIKLPLDFPVDIEAGIDLYTLRSVE